MNLPVDTEPVDGAVATAAEEHQLRLLLYSHDGLGLGHTRRNLTIATALTQINPHVTVLLGTGTDEIYRLGVAQSVGILKLPGLVKIKNDHYEGRRLRIPQSDLWELRASLLTTAVRSFRPDELAVKDPQKGLAGERSLSVVRDDPGVDAVVSFVGLPRLSDADLRQLNQRAPKLVAVSRSRRDLDKLFDWQVAQLVIVPRFKFPSPVAGKPQTYREWFDKYFQAVRSASELPAQRPD